MCLDGKQRCTSVQNFIDGRIPFLSPGTKEKFWYTTFPGQRGGKELPKALKQRFDNLNIQIVEYAHLSVNEQRDIFRELLCKFSKLTFRACPARDAALGR